MFGLFPSRSPARHGPQCNRPLGSSLADLPEGLLAASDMMNLIVKLGGELISAARREELLAIVADLAELIRAGHRLVLVHGGGPQTSELQRAMGQEPNFIGGRRVTDAPTLDALKMVVGGKLNVDLCQVMSAAGVEAVGLNGVSAGLIRCQRRPKLPMTGSGGAPVDLGFVGDVTGLNHRLLDLLLDTGYTPVLACIGSDESGQPYNINADAVANAVAEHRAADALLLITNIPGVLRDVEDKDSRITQLSVAEGEAAIAEGLVQGGMIPKLEESFRVLQAGVSKILILGELGPGDLIKALGEPGSIGTALVP